VKGKLTADDEVRKRGVEQALSAMDDERETYLHEKEEAEKGMDSDVPRRRNLDQKSPDSSRDISAI
jgi:hypothetical protein